MDISTAVFLTNPMNPAEALAVRGIVKIDAVIDTGIGCRQRDSDARRVDLADENHRMRICLELLNPFAAFLFFNVAINRNGLDRMSFQYAV